MGILYINTSTGIVQEARDPNEMTVRTENDAQAKRHAEKLLLRFDASKRWRRFDQGVRATVADEDTESLKHPTEPPADPPEEPQEDPPAGEGRERRVTGSHSGAPRRRGPAVHKADDK